MVAIVAGSSLGVSLTSLATIGKDGSENLWGSIGRGAEQVFVNSETGNLVVQGQDEYVAARGTDISGLRTYNSLGKIVGGVQDSWAVGQMRQKVVLSGTWGAAGSTIVRTGADGAEATYTWNSTSSRYESTTGAGAIDVITKDASSNFLWTDGSTQATETYSATIGRITKSTDADQNSIVYAYDGSGRLASAAGADGELFKYNYTAAGDLQSVTTQLPGGSATQRVYYAYDADGKLLTQIVQSNYNGAVASTLTNTQWDGAGNVTKYTVNQSGIVNTYTTTLAKYDGYKESTVTGASTVLRPGNTASSYDVNGFLIGVNSTSTPADNRTFINDASGQVLATLQGGNIERELIVNGEVLAQYGSGVDQTTPRDTNGQPIFNSNIANFQFGYRSITPSYPAATLGNYTVKSGDTLRTIAQSAFGDADLWYEIADANHIDGDSDLRVGMSIVVPNAIASHNNANTFQPYDPSKMVGDTTPYLARPLQNGDDFGEFLSVIIAAIATVYTAGLAAGALAAEGSAIASMGAFEAGGAVFAGESGLGGLAAAAGAAGGATGSVAGQLTNMAAGNQSGFDWSGVALGAIGGAASAGVAGEMTASDALANNSLLSQQIARAAISASVSQGVGVITGLQKSFSWQAVAASAVGVGVGGSAADAISGSEFGHALGTFGVKAVSGMIGGATTAVLHGGRMTAQQVAVDVFGNAIGQGMANRSAGGEISTFRLPPPMLAANAGIVTDAGNGYGQILAVAEVARWPGQESAQEGFRISELDAQYSEVSFSQRFGPGVRPSADGILLPDGSNIVGHALGAYAKAYAATPDIGGARDAAAGAQMVDQINNVRAQLASAALSDPTGSVARQLNLATSALLAKDAYYKDGIAELLPSGVTRLSGDALAPLGINDRRLQPNDGSGFQAAAYFDTNRNSVAGGGYVVAFKGTTTRGWTDVLNDYQQAIGLFSQQYQDAHDLAVAVKYSSASANVEYSGHSLGGGLASLASVIGDAPARTFNAAGLNPVTALRFGANIDSANKINAYYVVGDPLSALQDGSEYFPRAAGTRYALPSTGPVQLSSYGIAPGVSLSGLQRLGSTLNGSLHFMGAVESAIFTSFPVFRVGR